MGGQIIGFACGQVCGDSEIIVQAHVSAVAGNEIEILIVYGQFWVAGGVGAIEQVLCSDLRDECILFYLVSCVDTNRITCIRKYVKGI